MSGPEHFRTGLNATPGTPPICPPMCPEAAAACLPPSRRRTEYALQLLCKREGRGRGRGPNGQQDWTRGSCAIKAERVCRLILPGVHMCSSFKEGILRALLWGAIRRSQSAPHMHVLLCICSTVRHFFHNGWSHTIAMIHTFLSMCTLRLMRPCFVNPIGFQIEDCRLAAPLPERWESNSA